MPVDRPTVAKADVVSNTTSRSGRLVSAESRIVPPPTALTPKSATVVACRTMRWSMRRSKAMTSSSPRASATMTRNSTTTVVTFSPPAVPADPPPMNISMAVPSSVSSVTAP